MNKGTIVLVGCIVGAGGLFYLQTNAGASRPVATDPTAVAASSTPELAHSQTTPKKSTSPSVSATVATVTATPPKQLSLIQVKNLPRPASSGSGPGYVAPSNYPAATEVPQGPATPAETPASVPSAQPTPVVSLPSEIPTTPTPAPATPAPNPNPWPIATPPTLPPYPDAGLAPIPPSE